MENLIIFAFSSVIVIFMVEGQLNGIPGTVPGVAAGRRAGEMLNRLELELSRLKIVEALAYV